MIGGLSLATVNATSGGSTSFNLVPDYGCVGEFLVGLALSAPTDIAATMMVDVTRIGSGITTPEPVFRTRHVQRRIWVTMNDWRHTSSYNVPANQTTITWLDSSVAGAPSTMPTGRWSNPFTKPKNWATANAVITGFTSGPYPYLDESLSTVSGDRYAPSSSVFTEADPVLFTCSIGDLQYLRFEAKYYVDDPFKIDPTTPTPTLSDVIPTTASPSDSEVDATQFTGSFSAWMLRV